MQKHRGLFANTVPGLLAGHNLRLEQAKILALLVIACVPEGHSESVKTLFEAPRVPGIPLALALDYWLEALRYRRVKEGVGGSDLDDLSGRGRLWR